MFQNVFCVSCISPPVLSIKGWKPVCWGERHPDGFEEYFQMSRLFIVIPVFLSLLCGAAFASKRPNILIIMADDCTFSDLPLYGGRNAQTPNIDALAAQGLTFNRAYLSSAMCQPCRAELFTGRYPMSNGCAWNHSASHPDVSSMPHHLSRIGYRVGISGKVHVKPANAFPFESVPGFDPNCVRSPTRAHDLAGVREFVSGQPGQPFCLVVALVEPHVPWVMGDASAYPPQKIQLPPNIADTPRTRADFGRYLAEITYMDGQVGELLDLLDVSGMAEDTLVLFTSEQGSQFPGCKWTNWDTGLHTALVARWPGRTPVGTRTNAMVQYCDVLPTLMEAAGEIAEHQGFDGTSFLKVLTAETDQHRDYVYGSHNNFPEGPPYPIRTVTDGTYRYIRNLTPNEIYIEKHLMGSSGDGKLNNPYWASWIWDSQKSEATYRLVRRYMSRPAEQLYNTAQDPYEMINLIDAAKENARLIRLRRELDRWMADQNDPGAPQDSQEAHQAAKRGRHLYRPHGLSAQSQE